jgi:hypothetical protein
MRVVFEAPFVRLAILMFPSWNANVWTREKLSLVWYACGCVNVTYGLICSLWIPEDGVTRVTTLKIENSQHTSSELVSISYPNAHWYCSQLWRLHTEEGRMRSWNNVTGIGFGLSCLQFWFMAGARDFAADQPTERTQPYVLWVLGTLYPGEELLGCKINHSLPSSAEVIRMSGSLSPLPLYALMSCMEKTLPLPRADWREVFYYQ